MAKGDGKDKGKRKGKDAANGEGKGAVKGEDKDAGSVEFDGPKFEKAPLELASMLQVLRDRHHKRLGSCGVWALLHDGGMKYQGEDVDAKVAKSSPRERCLIKALTDGVRVDAFILVRREHWEDHLAGRVTKKDMDRLIDHELCHLDWDSEKEALSLKAAPHEFPDIVKRYGVDERFPLLAAVKNALQLAFDLVPKPEKKGKKRTPASAGKATPPPAA